MKASAGGPYSRVAMAIIAAAVVVAVAIIASPIIGTPKIVTTTDNLTSTASLTITDVIVSNRTITVSVTEDRPYALVINPGTIVSGQAVSIPGCASTAN